MSKQTESETDMCILSITVPTSTSIPRVLTKGPRVRLIGQMPIVTGQWTAGAEADKRLPALGVLLDCIFTAGCSCYLCRR